MNQAWWITADLLGLLRLVGLLGLLALIAGAAWLGLQAWKQRRSKRQEAAWEHARKEFRLRREGLEAKFFQLAARTGKPRGLRWVDVVFDNDVAFARDRRTNELSSFVGVSIRFEAIEGGGMEEVEAVGNIRVATAVFHLRQTRWSTEGQALFNVNPAEAIQRYHDQFELVSQDGGRS